MSGADAEQRDFGGEPIDEEDGAFHVLAKGRRIVDIVIARKDDHRSARVPGNEVEKPEDDPRTRIAVTGLHEDVAGRNVEQLWQGELEVAAVHDHERPLSRHERVDPPKRRFEKGTVAHDSAILLRDGCAGDLPRESL